jgi:curli production assembly/transport component CsgF
MNKMKAISNTFSAIARSARAIFAGLAAIVCLAISIDAIGTEMVYVPVNPNFGGNPQNAIGLLGTAQATNKSRDPNAPSLDPLHQFNDMLERAVLSRLSYAATSSLFGPLNNLIPGSVETGNFRIDIVDMGGGLLQITTTDKVTGNSTSFQVGGQ